MSTAGGNTYEVLFTEYRGAFYARLFQLPRSMGSAEAVFRAAFRLAPASPEVEALARTYLGIRIWGAPAAIAVYALTGWLIARQTGAQPSIAVGCTYRATPHLAH